MANDQPAVIDLAIVGYAFNAEFDNEMSASVHDVVGLLEASDLSPGWALCQDFGSTRGGRKGLVPIEYLKYVPHSAVCALRKAWTRAPSVLLCEAQFDYTPDDEGAPYISLKRGDVVVVTSTTDGDSNQWWTGEVHGIAGLFPHNFVARLNIDVPVALSQFEPRSLIKDIQNSSDRPTRVHSAPMSKRNSAYAKKKKRATAAGTLAASLGAPPQASPRARQRRTIAGISPDAEQQFAMAGSSSEFPPSSGSSEFLPSPGSKDFPSSPSTTGGPTTARRDAAENGGNSPRMENLLLL